MVVVVAVVVVKVVVVVAGIVEVVVSVNVVGTGVDIGLAGGTYVCPKHASAVE